MREFKHSLRVYYKDTDCAGVVYYARYLEFLEIARTEVGREMGFSFGDLIKNYGVIFPVVNVDVRYKKPAVLDDWLTTTTTVKSSSALKLEFSTLIHNEKGELLVEATVTNVCLSQQSFRPTKIPADILSLFQKAGD